jgi:hypothetical protein
MSRQSLHSLHWEWDSRKTWRDRLLIVGHQIVNEVQVRGSHISIDTGCYLGNKLSAVFIDRKSPHCLRILSVKRGWSNSAAIDQKTIRSFRSPTDVFIEYRNYEETRERFSEIVAARSSRGKNFTDSDLLDVLTHFNSFCRFQIEHES